LTRALYWNQKALQDRVAIMDYIAEENPVAAIELDIEFENYAEQVQQRPTLYKVGRVAGTREIVVRPNYIMVYRFSKNAIEILRVLHAAQEWPI
jgi:toxin ParE1/3/4